MEGASEPPVFDEWGELLKEGVVAAIISFVYQLVPIIVFTVTLGGSFLAILSGSEAGAGLGMFGFLGAFVVWGLLSLVFGYVGFAGVANYAKVGSLGAGFDLSVIKTVVTSRDYIVAWLYVIGLQIVAGAISGIIPFIGWIAAPFISFYALIIAGWLWGDGFASATSTQSAPSVDDAAPA